MKDWPAWSFKFKAAIELAIIQSAQQVNNIKLEEEAEDKQDKKQQLARIANRMEEANKKALNTMIYYTLVNVCEGYALHLVRGAQAGDGEGALKLLEAHYNGNKVHRIQMLQTELFDRNMGSKYQNVEHMMQRVTEIKREMDSLEVKLIDQIYINVIELALPHYFDAYISGLNDTAKQKLEDFINGIQLFNEKQKLKLLNNSTRETVLLSKQNTNCFRCGKLGHKAANCRTQLPSKPKEVETKKNEVKFCTNCKKNGHTVQDCWLPGGGRANQRYKHTNKKSTGHPKREVANNSEHEALLGETRRATTSEPNIWIIDSGATSHMTYDKEDFYNYEPVKDEVIKLADDHHVEIEGKGEIRMGILTSSGEFKVKLQALYVPKLRRKLISVIKATNEGNQFNEEVNMLATKNESMIMRWHEKLGHMGVDAMEKFFKESKIEGLPKLNSKKN
eukprot:c16218_g1_i3.p1 GENE.c16218_g1_i3~~c16218_g1_i3.p1  ORF type:complete len:448 (+),score=83.87 c16218_g1_i3:292-1635(+)